MRKLWFIFMIGVSPWASLATPLPRLNIDPESVTVSGLSSGAFMSVQMLVSFSSVVRGAAIFAGGPYNCSEGQLIRALSVCMGGPERIKVEDLVSGMKKAEADGHIDALKNLNRAKLYIFSSPADTVVKEGSGAKLSEQLQTWIPTTSIRSSSLPGVQHGIPTLNFGNECGKLGSPFLQKCGVDGVGQGFLFLYGMGLKQPRALTAVELQSALVDFDQSKGSEAAAQLADRGYLYVPPACAGGAKKCRLHVVLHGCDQGSSAIGRVFIENSGHLNWAVTNDIVLLFPQVSPSRQNPKGCWDWFAYTGSDFARKSGPQMKALRSFIEQVAGF